MRRFVLSAPGLQRSMLLALLSLGLGGQTAPASTNLSVWAYPGPSGRLLTQPDALGNRMMDCSGVGYLGGLLPLPSSNTVPVKVTIAPVAGDNVANLQNAISQVSALPLDPNGFRGAVLLSAGTYILSNTVTISASGVVLRGVGSSTNGTGTVLRAAAAKQYTLLELTGSGSASTVSGTTHTITNRYVPVGARSFYVDSASGLSVGDTVYVTRVATSNWIHDLGMDLIGPAPDVPWSASGYNMDMERVITHLEGNHVFVDAPITCAIDAHYTNGTIRKFTWPGRIQNVGVEHIYAVSDYFGNTTNENHGWTFIQFDKVVNGWVRDVNSQYFGYSCVSINSGDKFVTVADSQSLDPISIITGGRRYAFVMNDVQYCLVKNCYTRQDRHQFVTQSLTIGPNVFVDGLSDDAHAEAGPHQRWATGILWDNITVHGGNNDAQNAGNYGTGHGWEGANCTIWNNAANGFIVQNPPGAHNWLIGSVGPIQNGTAYVGPHDPGTYDSSGSSGANVFPDSYYFAQLQDRLAAPGLQTRDYWLGEMDGFTNSAPAGETVPVDGAWRTAVQAMAGSQALDGFDVVASNHWVPFTFTFSLGATEHVVAATLALSLRATNSAAGDVLCLGSTSNVSTFSGLGWLPVTTALTNATVRVLDLASQLLLLTNGQLNVAVAGDIGVDWAMFEVQVAPDSSAAPVSLTPAADATVRGGAYASQNFGATNTLTVKNDATADNTRQAYLRWDLSGVTNRIFQARVRLTPVSVGTNAIEQGIAVAANDTWTETGMTWNNQPGGGERFANWIPGAGAPLSFDVTPQVLDALTGDKQLSLELFSVRNVGSAGSVDYAAREYSDPSSRPQLLLWLLGSPPVISSFTNLTVPVDGSSGPLPFTVGDTDSSASSLVVSGSSSDLALVPEANIVFGGSGSNRTVTVTPAGNRSGSAVITITVTDSGGLFASASFTLTVGSHAPGVFVWNGPGAGLNPWSVGGNWLPTDPPESLDDVKFFDKGATGLAVSNVNNVVDGAFGGVVASLQYGNTNGNHTTLIGPDNELTISGAGGFVAGTETDNGNAQTVSATITGPGGALTLDNPGANLIVRQGAAASGGSQRATLDLSGLGTFTATLNQILVGFAGPVIRSTGTLYLGKTNAITVSGTPGMCAGDNPANNGGQHFIYLGQTNAIFADSITLARQKATATLRFNPVFVSPAAYFRASDGASRVSVWNIADHSLQSTSSSACNGTNDFSGGTVDALVDTMSLGTSQKTTGNNSTGVLTFTGGTVDVNTLRVGVQAASGATSAGTGRVNVNGAGALLVVNTLLELGHTSGGAGTSNTFGTLFINNGTVQANALSVGAASGTNTLAINHGVLAVTATAGTLALPINNVTLTNSRLQLAVSGDSPSLAAASLTTGGSSNVIDISSLPAIASYPSQFTLVKYTGAISGAGYDFVLGAIAFNAACGGYLSNHVANGSIDLVITNCVGPDAFLTWDGTFGGDWDTETANWKDNLAPDLIYAEGNSVLFNDAATGPTTVNLTAELNPGAVTVSNNLKTYTFTGLGSLSGGASLAKDDAGTLILANSGSNDFTGITLVNAGILALTGTSALGGTTNITIAAGATLDVSGRSDGTLTLASGQTLQGNGTLTGSLLAGPGSTVAPGGSIGALTVTNLVTLQGTTLMELDHANGTNDVLRGAASLTFAGTLSLAFTPGSLTATDSFRLFSAGTYSGSFANLVPATPGLGLVWDLGQLTSNGTLRVALAGSGPHIVSFLIAGGNLVLAGNGGSANASYYLLGATNLAQPLAAWTRLRTNSFDSGGNFNLTYPLAPGTPRQFYRLQVP